MKRRAFITLLGGQPAMPVIGFLHSGSAEPFAEQVAGLREGLN